MTAPGAPQDPPPVVRATLVDEAPATPDVLVVGGGVIGLTVARALALRGIGVVVAERGAPGSGATTAAAGVLAVAGGADDGTRLALRRASAARWPALVAALTGDTGLDAGFRRDGSIALALGAKEAARLRSRVAERCAQGFRAAWLDADALRAEAPVVAPAACGAAAFEEDAAVDPVRLVAALVASARVRGVTVLVGAAVRGAECAGGRVRRVDVAGRWLSPGTVVLAAGAWSARVPGLPAPLPVRPVRGQMLALRAPAGAIRRVVAHGDGYLVPRDDGTVLVGATMEEAGFDATVTPAGLTALAAHLARLAPEALGWAVVRSWAGLRPAIDDGPVIARHPDYDNVVVATGHHRTGILLAPVTADAVTALVEAGVPPPEAVPFGWPVRRR